MRVCALCVAHVVWVSVVVNLFWITLNKLFSNSRSLFLELDSTGDIN